MAMDTTEAPQIIEHITKNLDYTPYETKWIPLSPRLVVLGVSPSNRGVIAVHGMSGGAAPELCRFDHKHGVRSGTFGASRLEDRELAFGDFGGRLSICDLERGPVAGDDGALYSVQAHDGVVNAIDGFGGSTVSCGAPELATAGRDGCVRIWDPRCAAAVASLEPAEGEAARDCWTVSFGGGHDERERCVCAGYDNGDVKMFDLRTGKMAWEVNVGNGVTAVDFDRKDIQMNKMVVTTLESKFRLYDLRTQHKTDGFAFLSERAHKSTIWGCSHLPQNRDIFLTTGGNGGLNIYKYHYPSKRMGTHPEDGAPIGIAGGAELLNSRVVSTQPVVGLDWSAEYEGLCCAASLDQTLRIFIVTKLNKY